MNYTESTGDALLSPAVIITSTNIHLFYDVFLMGHISVLIASVVA